MKRLIIVIILTFLLNVALLPLCSSHLLQGSFESIYTNKNLRVDFSLRESKPDSLRIISHNDVKKIKWDKTGNTLMVQEEIIPKWQKYKIRVQAVKKGIIYVYLRGPYNKTEDVIIPVLVDYRNLRINDKLIMGKQQGFWHNDPFLYKLEVKDNEIVDISFEARRHHFRFKDVTKVYTTNFWILIAMSFISFIFSWKLVNYIEKTIKKRHVNSVDIVFVCLFFGFLFIPMSSINTAEKSEQENRTLAKKPTLFNNTGGGYNLRFGKEAEEWFNDRFFGRDLALKLDIAIKLNLVTIHKKGSSLYIPNNNWMFNMWRLDAPSKREISEIENQLKIFNEFCKQNNIKLYILLVPRKGAVYHEILEKNYYYDGEGDLRFSRYIDQLHYETRIPFIYPYEELRKASGEDYVFFKQAHHWTDWGAYQGYLALMKEIARDFPDIKTVSLGEYKKFSSKLIRDEWNRDFNMGSTTKALGIDAEYARRNLLRDEYIYYDHKNDNAKMGIITDNIRLYTKKSEKYKILLTGNSQNENLLQFMPYSAHQLKYIRLNRGKLSAQEQNKFLKYYQNEVLNFKPDILIYCMSSEDSKKIFLNITKK